MKNLFLLIPLLISLSTYSQEKKDSVDTMNRLLISTIGNMNISNNAQRDLLIHKIDSIAGSSIDPVVKEQAQKSIDRLNKLKFMDVSGRSLSDLSKDDLKGFRINYDKFQKINFIHSKAAVYNKLEPYIGLTDSGNLYLRLITIYESSSWVFFNKAHLIIDGKDYIYTDNDTKRDVLSGVRVKEKSDLTVDEYLYDMLKALANSKEKVSIRFSGREKVDDTFISEKNIKDIAKVLELYEKLKM